jgi:hypothetical protein
VWTFDFEKDRCLMFVHSILYLDILVKDLHVLIHQINLILEDGPSIPTCFDGSYRKDVSAAVDAAGDFVGSLLTWKDYYRNEQLLIVMLFLFLNFSIEHYL